MSRHLKIHPTTAAVLLSPAFFTPTENIIAAPTTSASAAMMISPPLSKHKVSIHRPYKSRLNIYCDVDLSLASAATSATATATASATAIATALAPTSATESTPSLTKTYSRRYIHPAAQSGASRKTWDGDIMPSDYESEYRHYSHVAKMDVSKKDIEALIGKHRKMIKSIQKALSTIASVKIDQSDGTCDRERVITIYAHNSDTIKKAKRIIRKCLNKAE